MRLGLLGAVGELDAAGLHPPAGQHLGLDHHRAADLLGSRASLLRACCRCRTWSPGSRPARRSSATRTRRSAWVVAGTYLTPPALRVRQNGPARPGRCPGRSQLADTREELIQPLSETTAAAAEAPTKNQKLIAWVEEFARADRARRGPLVRRLGGGVRPPLPGAGRQGHVREALRRQAAQLLPGALRPRRRRPGRGPHLHLLREGGRRRPHQQLARSRRDARGPRASSSGARCGGGPCTWCRSRWARSARTSPTSASSSPTRPTSPCRCGS